MAVSRDTQFRAGMETYHDQSLRASARGQAIWLASEAHQCVTTSGCRENESCNRLAEQGESCNSLRILYCDILTMFKHVWKQVEHIVAEQEDNEKGATAAQRTPDAQPSRTIFETILTSSLPPLEKAVDRLTDEAFVMTVAGGETTAKSLTNAVYHLLANPDWLKLVVAEIDRAMPDVERLPSTSELELLPILTAAIKETLRVSAPVTNRVQVLDSEQILMFGEWTIPPGTPMSKSIPAIHLSPRIYKEPMVFNPGRFLLEHSSEEEVRHANKYYMPFHRGFRSCLGQNLSYAELYLALAAVLRRFELELQDVVRERDVDTVRDCLVGMPSPQAKPVQVRIVAERK